MYLAIDMVCLQQWPIQVFLWRYEYLHVSSIFTNILQTLPEVYRHFYWTESNWLCWFYNAKKKWSGLQNFRWMHENAKHKKPSCNLGPKFYCFMKKTRLQKFPAGIPLNWFIIMILLAGLHKLVRHLVIRVSQYCSTNLHIFWDQNKQNFFQSFLWRKKCGKLSTCCLIQDFLTG